MTSIDIGVLFNTDRLVGPQFTEYAQRLESVGVGSVWFCLLYTSPSPRDS